MRTQCPSILWVLVAFVGRKYCISLQLLIQPGSHNKAGEKHARLKSMLVQRGCPCPLMLNSKQQERPTAAQQKKATERWLKVNRLVGGFSNRIFNYQISVRFSAWYPWLFHRMVLRVALPRLSGRFCQWHAWAKWGIDVFLNNPPPSGRSLGYCLPRALRLASAFSSQRHRCGWTPLRLVALMPTLHHSPISSSGTLSFADEVTHGSCRNGKKKSEKKKKQSLENYERILSKCQRKNAADSLLVGLWITSSF